MEDESEMGESERNVIVYDETCSFGQKKINANNAPTTENIKGEGITAMMNSISCQKIINERGMDNKVMQCFLFLRTSDRQGRQRGCRDGFEVYPAKERQTSVKDRNALGQIATQVASRMVSRSTKA